MALDPVAQQQDFSLGTFRSGVLEREPDGAAETIQGLIADDGLPFKRGGAAYDTTSGIANGLRWVKDAALLGGRRTIMGGPGTDGLYRREGDGSVTNLTSGQAYNEALNVAWPEPVRVAVCRGVMYPEPPEATGHTVTTVQYGGATKALYSTGTVAVTTDDTAVVGTGTSWLANAERGMLFVVGTTVGMVDQVVDNTHLTLRSPWGGGGGGGHAYWVSVAGVAQWSLPAPVFLESIANRIIRGYGQQLDFSGIDDLSFDPDDYHSFPESVRGFGDLRDVLLVFTDGGVWSVSNLALPIVDPATGDPQQRKELVNADLVLWDRRGIADWSGALVVPALDNVYVMDSLGAPTPIGDRILDLYLSYVAAGHKLGVGSVYNGEYVLPVLSSSNVWVDTLVCRLRPTHSQVAYGWSQLAGSGAKVGGFSVRHSSPPKLVGAALAGRVLDLSGWWTQAAPADADGSAVTFVLATVDYPTGNMVENFVHKVRLKYALGAGSVTAEASFDGGAWTALSGSAPATAAEWVWRASGYGRNVRFRFTSSVAGSLVAKSVEVFVRHSGKQ